MGPASARSADRPQLQAMLTRLREGAGVDYVIVHKVDRLARSRQDDVLITLVIRKAGAKLVSTTENIDETASGKLVHGIMATIAEFYSANLGTEALKGMTQKAKMGGTPGRAPIGYLNVREIVDAAVANGMVYVGSDTFYAFDARTGRIRWSADTGGGEVASAAVANGAVYVGSSDGNVYAFDGVTGEELWVAPTGGSITDSQATIIANGVVYVGSQDDSVFALDAETGEQLWSYQTGGSIRKQSVVNGTLYVTSFDDHLYAFRLPG